MVRKHGKKNGFFVVMEGIDGCGKDTQLDLLSRYLKGKGYNVLLTTEPTNGKIGMKIRQKGLSGKSKYTDLEMQLMFSLDRKEHVEKEILPALAEGKIVISGRYTLSTLAYGFARGLDMELLESANAAYPKPDLVIYIDLDYRTAIRRLDKRGGTKEIYENSETLRRTEEGYKRILGKFKTKVVDGSRSPEEVRRQIERTIDSYL